MKQFIKAEGRNAPYSPYKFTNGKYYEVLNWVREHGAEVKDDDGCLCVVSVESQTLRLAGNGRFRLVSNEIANALSNACAKVDGWKINDSGKMTISSKAIASENYKPAEYISPERLRRVEKDRDMYKQDCIKAEAVIDQLYDLFPHVRNHEQLVSAVKSAKIFSDAFMELQKIK